MALQSDGKIVVAGGTYNGSNDDFALARYNADGSLDTTFDVDGKLTTDFASLSDSVSSIALQSDGKIVVAGDTTTAVITISPWPAITRTAAWTRPSTVTAS